MQGDLTVEESIAASFRSAIDRFGPVNILVANAGITDESAHPPIWDVDVALWDKVRDKTGPGTLHGLKLTEQR